MSDNPRPAACWCRANYCARQVPAGAVLCERHAGLLRERCPDLAGGLLAHLRLIDPRGVESLPCNLDTLHRLETIAEAVELIADAERNNTTNVYRIRATHLRSILARGEPAGDGAQPTVQSRLLEPESSGAYGPAGRRQ